MYFGQAIKLGWDGTGGVELFVFLGGEASCLFNVFKKGNEFVFELGYGILGEHFYVLVSWSNAWALLVWSSWSMMTMAIPLSTVRTTLVLSS